MPSSTITQIINNPNFVQQTDISSIIKTTTGKVTFYKGDSPVLSISEEKDIYIDYNVGAIYIVCDRGILFEFTFWSLDDIQGRPYLPILQDGYNFGEYQSKCIDIYEDLNENIFVGCCECGGGTSNVSFVDELPTTGTVDILYVVRDPFSLNIWNGTTYDTIGGSGDFVPYTGATSDVDLGTFGLTTEFVDYNTTPSSTLQAGRTQWNDSDGTLDVRLKGNNVTLQVGQENVIRVVNKVGSSLNQANYQVVRNRTVGEGGAQGQRLAVLLAQADSVSNFTDTLGIVTETIANNQEGFITNSGIVRDINTTGSLQGETWADGDVLYLSDTVAGGLTKVPPTSFPVRIGFVVYSHASNGKIFVKVDETNFDYIPLSGTVSGRPVTGDVEMMDIVQLYNGDLDNGPVSSIYFETSQLVLRKKNSSNEETSISITDTNQIGIASAITDFKGLAYNSDWSANFGLRNLIDLAVLKSRFWTKAGTPTTTDDSSQGYLVDSIIHDTTTNILYVCTSNTASAATWEIYYDPSVIVNNQTIALTGSNVTTTSATAVDVTGLVTPTLPANSTWYFEIYLSVTCSGAGGIRFGFTAPSGSNGALFIVGTATTAATYQQTSTTGALAGTAINRAATSSLGTLYGRVIIGANAGAVQLQFASTTGGQTSTIVGTGISIMRITRVA